MAVECAVISRNIPADVSDLLAQAPHSVGVGYTPAHAGSALLFRDDIGYFPPDGHRRERTRRSCRAYRRSRYFLRVAGVRFERLQEQKTRVSYITIANLFNIALALILSVNVLQHAPENVTQLV